MDPSPKTLLLRHILLEEIEKNQNPYLTIDTLYRRAFKSLEQEAGTNFITLPNPSMELFHTFHNDIITLYQSKFKNFSIDEQTCIERVLCKDAPNSHELVKFSSVWMKHDPKTVYKWFAVDGILGNHPKFYIHEAFHPDFQIHANAIRRLYDVLDSPEDVKQIVNDAFHGNVNEITLYTDMVHGQEIGRMKKEREHQKKLQSSHKRKHIDAKV